MKNNTGKFIISLLAILGIQILASYFVGTISNFFGFTQIITTVLYCLIISVVFGLFNYPKRPLKYAFKDAYFYRYCCIIFIVLFLINWFL